MEDGRQRRDFVHVSDIAAANVLALTTPRPGFTPVNVSPVSRTPSGIWR
jgi:dTDP-L-rhamnose 4-epimerase